VGNKKTCKRENAERGGMDKSNWAASNIKTIFGLNKTWGTLEEAKMGREVLGADGVGCVERTEKKGGGRKTKPAQNPTCLGSEGGGTCHRGKKAGKRGFCRATGRR